MFTIPDYAKRLFDSVPLKSYKDDTEYIKPQQFFSFDCKQSALDIVLGVYNTFQYKDYILPTDPISLSTAIILAKKNGMGLPRTLSNSGPCGITCIPFRGSPFNSLPILIAGAGTGMGTIESIEKINSKIASNNFSNVEVEFMNEYVDMVLYDLWISCLLVEKLELKVYQQLFGVEDGMELMDLKTEIRKWNNFEARHQNLFEKLQKQPYLKNFYKSELERFTDRLSGMEDLLDSTSAEEMILGYKLAAFVIIIDQFLASTKIGEILCSNQCLIEKCYKVLNFD
ncbi:SAM35 [Candida oxycetoniae]|uniref:SAM35 n=1 Tax=Candida oxycetoniae TaxID=497107 RepID=A0AAI9WXX9_9ASCO|nr:SAM35 [Candida oxycetoniae]KAI3404544.2 SAM35 [Candida oxycetoniae]